MCYDRDRITISSLISSWRKSRTIHHFLYHQKHFGWLFKDGGYRGVWFIQHTRNHAFFANGLLCGTCGYVKPDLLYVLDADKVDHDPDLASAMPAEICTVKPWVALEPSQLDCKQELQSQTHDMRTTGVMYRVRD